MKTTENDQDDTDSVSRDHDDGSEETDIVLDLINFKSIRNSINIEEGVSFSWPINDIDTVESASNNIAEDKQMKTVKLTTLLKPDNLAPLFSGAEWAGTRLWNAAILAIDYFNKKYGDEIKQNPSSAKSSLLELGCGLGVPGMIAHIIGVSRVVLTDQDSILDQIRTNIASNFTSEEGSVIEGMTLNWSRQDIVELLENCDLSSTGFDFVLNCDCVYEPLYGKDSRVMLVEVIKYLLTVNPKCIVISSVERRKGDGVDTFLDDMKQMEIEHGVADDFIVELISRDEDFNIEIYETRRRRQ